MGRYRSAIIGFFALLVVIALATWGLKPVPRAPLTVGSQVGQIAPDFTLTRLNGSGKLRLWALRGHPVWVNFFASWCPPCNAEAYDLAQTAKKSPGLYVVGIDLTASETSLAKVDAFVSQYGIAYPVLLDMDNSVANRYGVQAIPTSFFIDRQGVIRAEVSMPLYPALIKKYLAKIDYRAE